MPLLSVILLSVILLSVILPRVMVHNATLMMRASDVSFVFINNKSALLEKKVFLI
jgi:hypothetical protein